jgi:hypothetical protein
MGTLFMAIPRATSAPFDLVVVATGTGLKTVLQVGIPTTTDIRIHGWGVSCKGVAASDPPGNVSLIDAAVAATAGTSLTPEVWESGSTTLTSLCVGGTAATAYNLTEPTHTAVRYLDGQAVHPQSGYSVFWPEARHPSAGFGVTTARSLAIRCLFTVTVNVIPWILWEEPG